MIHHRLPLRFYMEVGLQEPAEMILPNRHLRDVLMLKGYDISYTEFNGGHNYVCWRGSLADSLIKLISNK
jgi:enterochelin esterase-like enzyme